jgi:beta-glucosidase
MSQPSVSTKLLNQSYDERALALIEQMTLTEKIGQMSQLNGSGGDVQQGIREGRVGSVLNEVDVERVNELQRLAMEESRLGIPLLIGRDVIHGFKTIFPIPLAQAASWNPSVVKHCAAIAAAEAASRGINWTFAPMIDITRDPRWGRIAESLGEDPHLCSVMGAAMVQGFQGDTLGGMGSIAACAKHMAGYGAVESGLDYNTVNIPENELRNVYLRPFHAALKAGVATFMSSFSDLNGVPASGNNFLMQQVLRREWGFEGFVVSDWDSIKELSVHGFTDGDKASALAAVNAGIDMEMASSTYAEHLDALLQEGRVNIEQIDTLVFNILQIKLQLGLFENPYTNPSDFPAKVNEQYLRSAKKAAQEACVLLKNDHNTLPLSSRELNAVALIGPLGDEAYEQMGTWVFDGESRHSHTCLQGMHALVGDELELHWARGTQTSRSNSDEGFAEAVAAAQRSDTVVMFVGEESILSGEAHCRANIDLPGNQVQLIEAIAATGKPITLVVLAGRPLTLSNVIDKVAAILYAWHPGTMAGPAIAELLFGLASPSGKLPVSFPRSAGQIPIYYAKKNTGRPPSHHNITHIDDIDGGAVQTSLGMSAFHLDDGFTPLFPFGYGLSYSHFELSDLALSDHSLALGQSLQITVQLHNTGNVEAEEVVQLYTRDLVGNVTRPIKELKGFQKIRLAAGQSQQLTFELHTDELAFYNQQMQLLTETGDFHLWVGNSSEQGLWAQFNVV